MLKAFWHFLVAFFWSESDFLKLTSKAVAYVRSTLMVAGLTSVAFAEQIAAYVHNPLLAEKIKLGGVVVAGLAVMLRAGDKTPEAVKALAAPLEQPKP